MCDGNVPEEGAALEAVDPRAANAHRVLHGKIDATWPYTWAELLALGCSS